MLSEEQKLEFKEREQKQEKEEMNQLEMHLTEEDVLRITKTAVILLDIDRIKEHYDEHNWSDVKNMLRRFYRFRNHSNEKVANAIFSELLDISNRTRAGMTLKVAYLIESLVFTFFPSSYEKEADERLVNGKLCVSIGFGLVYDALIYIDATTNNSLKIALNGLSILKFIYRKGKERDMPQLMEKVLETYEELEQTLNRPERKDLENGKELIKFFRADLDNHSLSWPVLPSYLFDLVK